MVYKGAHGNEKSRREILELTGAAGAAGALGSLAGCLGSSGDDGGGGDNGSGGGDSGGDNGSGGGGGGSEAITIQFLSAGAAENSTATTAFQKSMKNYEEMRGNVTVDLQKASYGDVKSKLSSTVAAGNSPALAEAGSAGLSFYLDGEVPEHGQWIEATEGYPDQWTTTNEEVANFREEWWGGGAASGSARGVALRPKLVSQVGVSDPLTEMENLEPDVRCRLEDRRATGHHRLGRDGGAG